jgi:protein KTI12
LEVISLDSLKVDRASGHKDAASEKMTRGSFKSQVDRALNKDTLVIVDYLNYIKGWRYELYCIARACGTPSCVLWVDCPLEQAQQWNKSWPADTLNALASRFERPFETQRWDSPLFTVHPGDATPCAEIMTFLTTNNLTLPKNEATRPLRLAESNYLHVLESRTQQIVTHLAQKLPETECGADIGSIPEASVAFHVPNDRKPNVFELRKAKAAFIRTAQTRVPAADKIADLFVEFLNAQSAASSSS